MPVLATGLVPRGNLLKPRATSGQEESVHKALRHYITPVRAQLSIDGRLDKAYVDLLYMCSERKLTSEESDI